MKSLCYHGGGSGMGMPRQVVAKRVYTFWSGTHPLETAWLIWQGGMKRSIQRDVSDGRVLWLAARR